MIPITKLNPKTGINKPIDCILMLHFDNNQQVEELLNSDEKLFIIEKNTVCQIVDVVAFNDNVITAHVQQIDLRERNLNKLLS